MDLSHLSVGDHATIIGYRQEDKQYRKKLLSLGLTPRTEIVLIGIAPLGDPVEIKIRGHSLCLRRNEAKVILLEKKSA